MASTPLWLALLCSVSELLLPSHPFLTTQHFWSLVQGGLAHEDPLPRKRGLYLLRGATASLASPLPSSSPLLHPSPSLPSLLTSYYILLETLEEKQVHLVRQVLPSLALLACESCGEVAIPSPLHTSWVLVAYRRLLQHPSASLVRWGLESFLQQPWTRPALQSPAFQHFLTAHLLEAVNQSRLYSSEGECSSSFLPSSYSLGEEVPAGRVVAGALATFLHRTLATLGEGRGDEVVRRLLSSLPLHPWAPLPLYWLSSSLLHLPTTRCLSLLILLFLLFPLLLLRSSSPHLPISRC